MKIALVVLKTMQTLIEDEGFSFDKDGDLSLNGKYKVYGHHTNRLGKLMIVEDLEDAHYNELQGSEPMHFHSRLVLQYFEGIIKGED